MERKKERERERDTDRQTGKEKGRDRQREKERVTETLRERKRQREREKERMTESDREKISLNLDLRRQPASSPPILRRLMVVLGINQGVHSIPVLYRYPYLLGEYEKCEKVSKSRDVKC